MNIIRWMAYCPSFSWLLFGLESRCGQAPRLVCSDRHRLHRHAEISPRRALGGRCRRLRRAREDHGRHWLWDGLRKL